MLKGNSKDVSFEELMQQAAKVAQAQDAVLLEKKKRRNQEGSMEKEPEQQTQYTPAEKKPVASNKKDTSGVLYIKRPLKSKPAHTINKSTVHARDRIRLLFNAPAQKVFRPKRDRQSIEEIQREIRHSKGIYSDDEKDPPKKKRG